MPGWRVTAGMPLSVAGAFMAYSVFVFARDHAFGSANEQAEGCLRHGTLEEDRASQVHLQVSGACERRGPLVTWLHQIAGKYANGVLLFSYRRYISIPIMSKLFIICYCYGVAGFLSASLRSWV